MKNSHLGRRIIAVATAILLLTSAHAVELEDIDVPYEEFTLDNGLQVIVHTDHLTPVVSMNTWFHVGSKNEPEGKTGFAHLFEHLMFQGSENHNDEYFKPLQEVGATGINGTTNPDRTNYFQTVPTEAVDRMLWLESDRVTHLLGVISQERLDEQRGVVQNEKRQRANQPYGTAFEHMLRGVFPKGHPYRHTTIGSMEDLNAATLDDVFQWFEDYYGAPHIVIALAGDIDVDTAKELMQKYYGDAPAGEPIAKLQAWVPALESNRHEVMRDRAATGLIYRVWPMSSDVHDSVSMSLWGTAFASGRTSPLYKALVEEHKLASNVSANPIDFEIAGLFLVSISLLPDADPEQAQRVFDETLAEFLETGPNADRLERLKTQSLTSTIRGLERPAARASALVSGAVLENNPGHFKTELAEVQKATVESLDAAAERWLTQPYYELVGLPFGDFASAEEGANRAQMPDPGPPSNLTFPEVEERTLENGTRIVLVRRENLPVTDVTLRFDFGDANEPEEELGIASTAFGQLTSGTETLDAEAVSVEIERLGGYVSAGVGSTTSDVSTGGLTENLPELLALVADLLQHPTFPQDRLDISKGQRIAGIKRSLTDPNSVAGIALEEQLYGADHPFGRRTTEAHVEAITRDALVAFHEETLLGQPFRVLAVGDVTMDDLADMIETTFAGWSSAEALKTRAGPEDVAVPEAVRVFLIDMPATEQSVIRAAHLASPTPNEPRVDELIANEVIGGSFTSRINMNLREDKGWSYGARTYLTDTKFQRTFGVSAPVQVDKTAESLAEVHRELTEFLADSKASEEEFRLALERRIRSLASNYQTNGALLGSLRNNDYFGRPWNYPEIYGEALTKVTLDEVHEAAEALMRPGNLTYVVAGDLSVMEESVRELGLGEVIVIDVHGERVEADAG